VVSSIKNHNIFTTSYSLRWYLIWYDIG
jgi:hypothetical protein